MLCFGFLARGPARDILPEIVDLCRFGPDPCRLATTNISHMKAYSVRRSFATCGVIVIALVPVGTDTGGGRRKERYQYILHLCADDK